MSVTEMEMVRLTYGAGREFSCEMESRRISRVFHAPTPTPRFTEDLRAGMAHPLDFPPLEKAVFPGDTVALVVDGGTPHAETIIAEIWRVLATRDILPGDVTIVQASRQEADDDHDPRTLLPEEIRETVQWVIHDPGDRKTQMYLNASAAGDRIYLAKAVVEADVVLPIGPILFDAMLGYRGTHSAIFPGLSNDETIARSKGQGHSELAPSNERPLRQLVDEVGWLLGVLMSIQVIPARGDEASRILVGACDSVFRFGQQLLAQQWQVSVSERPDIVVAAVDVDADGHGWQQVGAALATARNLVAQDGKIVILSEMYDELTSGLRLITECESPDEAIRPLRELAPPDLNTATQFARAASWANVYLLSQNDPNSISDLFISPLENDLEVERLLEWGDSCMFLQSAQHVYGSIG